MLNSAPSSSWRRDIRHLLSKKRDSFALGKTTNFAPKLPNREENFNFMHQKTKIQRYGVS